MSAFDQAFTIVVGIEGKLSLDPNDPGNYRDGKLVGTKYGITARDHPDVDIPNLTLVDAKAIHQEEYWTPAGCDLLPLRAAVCAYDCAINQGAEVAVKLFQRALDIPPDGVLGPQSRAAFPQCKDPHTARFMGLRALRYAVTKNFEIDGSSWMTRLSSRSPWHRSLRCCASSPSSSPWR